MAIAQYMLMRQMVGAGVLKENFEMANRGGKKLAQDPVLCQKLVEHTAFLKYDADLITRAQCVVQNITEQPLCRCGGVLIMRTSGRFRYTFPSNCGKSCASSNKETKAKREQTNMQRYNKHNPLIDV